MGSCHRRGTFGFYSMVSDSTMQAMTKLSITEAAAVQMPMVRHVAEAGWARPESPALPPGAGRGLFRSLPHPADAVAVE